MAILNTALTKIGSKLFTPTEEVGAKRRKAVFGTESKAVATAAIVVPAAIALDVGLAKGAGTKAIASTIGAKIAKNPIKSTIIGLVGGGALATSPTLRTKTIEAGTKAPRELINVGKGIGTATEQFLSGDKAGAYSTFKQTIKDNPVGSTITGVGLLGVSAAGIYYGTKTIIDAAGREVDVNKEYEDYIKKINEKTENTDKLPKDKETKNDTINTNNTPPAEPDLVNVSRSVSRTRKRYSKSTPSFSPSLRLNIYNQTKSTKFIKFSKYTA